MSFSFVQGNPLENVLYKYRSFESAKLLLESESIYFSPPNDFNDPFEFSPMLLDTFVSKELAQTHMGSLDRVKALPYKERMRLHHKDYSERINRTIQKLIEKARNEHGVFCASEIFDNTLMWSHYGDNHKGVCIGLKFPMTREFMDFLILREHILPMYVNYVEEICIAPCIVNGKLFPDSTLNYWFSTKSKVWEYEKEVRLLNADKGKGPFKIGMTWLKEVHFGLLTPKNHIEEIISLVKRKNENCTFHKMEFKNGSFQLISKQITNSLDDHT